MTGVAGVVFVGIGRRGGMAGSVRYAGLFLGRIIIISTLLARINVN